LAGGLQARQARQARQRRNRWIAGSAVAAIIVIVGVLVGVKVSGNGSSNSGHGSTTTAATSPGATAPRQPAPAAAVAKVTSVPISTLVAGAAKVSGLSAAQPTTGDLLTSGGKPEVLYIGAEYCPVCATERWPMVVALSHFGTFSNLSQTHSAVTDGNIATFSFYGSNYTSSYLTFTPVEGYTNIPDKSTGFYTVLQTPTAAQQALLGKYDAANQGAIPFIDYGNRYVSIGASYNPALLSGLTWAQIASDLHDPSSTVAKSVLGTANFATAAICSLTGNQPASACTSAVRALQSKI
jgi:Domain of unknown function (DUF929)